MRVCKIFFLDDKKIALFGFHDKPLDQLFVKAIRKGWC